MLIIILFFIIRYKRRKSQDIDLNRETKNLANEQLMQDFKYFIIEYLIK